MISTREPPKSFLRSFRVKLLVAMMVVVSGITALVLYYAQHKVAANAERDLQREFQAELVALHNIQELRHAALVERCRALVRKSRIHAALEDGALDLLYPSAADELRDVMTGGDESPEQAAYGLHAEFYRFLDRNGAVIPPPNIREVGELQPAEEAQLALHRVPDRQQIGYLLRNAGGATERVTEVIAMPIISSETGEGIAALVLGFKPAPFGAAHPASGIRSGIWLSGHLHLATLTSSGVAALNEEITQQLAESGRAENSFNGQVAGVPGLFFYKQLNPGSLFPPALEVCIYPLDELTARQWQLRWQVLAAGGLLLLGALSVSHFLSGRLSRPVEKLEVDSAENLAQRQRVEAALELTSGELQRAARFSSDASHQLKTPVTVLRAGLEEWLAQENHTPEECHEISALIHQTYRLSSVIEDLLLLSRLDAGRLQLEFAPVNLTQLIEASLDDLGALPDELELSVETDFPPALHLAGEKRYTSLILQNLLENARKYNHPGGRIRITARVAGDEVLVTIGNTGRPIPAGAREHIFERFHRGAMGENVPGYGLGLNLARELARLHQGDLRLLRSDAEWTEFEVRFKFAQPAPGPVAT